MFSATPELSQPQVILLGFLATVLAQFVILQIAKRKGEKVGKTVATVVVFVVAIILSYAWSGISLALSGEDPMAMAGILVSNVEQVIALATVIYNVLLHQTFEKAGWTQPSPKPLPEPEPNPELTETIR